VTFADSVDVQVALVGDPDQGGFVQVRRGAVSDPERVRQLPRMDPDTWRAYRLNCSRYSYANSGTIWKRGRWAGSAECVRGAPLVVRIDGAPPLRHVAKSSSCLHLKS
jgi:hypothetical protein